MTVIDGEATAIDREQGSSEATGTVLGDRDAEDLGVLLDELSHTFPVDEEVPADHDLLFDTEWKVLEDGQLIIKQIRPFLR